MRLLSLLKGSLKMLFNIAKNTLPFSGCLYHRHKPYSKGSLKTKFRKAKVACCCASFNVSDAFAFAPYRGAGEIAALRASLDKRTLVVEKRMLRSAERRGEGSSIKRI